MVHEILKTEKMMTSERECVKGAGMTGEEKASKQARMVIQPKCRAPERNHKRDTEGQASGRTINPRFNQGLLLWQVRAVQQMV